MIKATINGKQEFTVVGNSLNGTPIEWDLIELRNNTFHIIKDYKNYNATLVSYSVEDKLMVLNVNGNDYTVSILDKNDLFLQQLGISSKSSSSVQYVKAPMPGLIINISISEGDEVKKGDALVILEAMKMENTIRAPRDGKIKKISVVLKQPVEKNQILIEFH